MNKPQNIFDNQKFFDAYTELRQTDDNYNVLLEQPAMMKLIPDLEGKSVIDIGCGYGHNCLDFVRRGAQRIVGVDISKKMLEAAKKYSSDEKIEYINLDMSRLDEVNESFDFAYSSLAFHYAENFEKLAFDVYEHLNAGGELLFSQEHPFTTATVGNEGGFERDENGNYISFTFSDYSKCGKRAHDWFVADVENYHRSFSEIINALARAGFCIEELCEPMPSEYALLMRPSFVKELVRPTFLIVKAIKK